MDPEQFGMDPEQFGNATAKPQVCLVRFLSDMIAENQSQPWIATLWAL